MVRGCCPPQNLAENAQEDEFGKSAENADYTYPDMKKKLVAPKKGTSFNLEVVAGQFSDSEIVVLLGDLPPPFPSPPNLSWMPFPIYGASKWNILKIVRVCR